MEKQRGVLLVGGPDMGKSNFLARFWGAVYRAKNGCLCADGLPDDLEHLNSILGELLSGKFAERTKHDEHWHCEIPLKTAVAGQYHGKLIVPDCPGEEWRRIYKNNEWSDVWEKLIDDVMGCLVFIRPNSDELRTPLDWMTCWKHFGTADMDAPMADETPTQVEMVYWMQCLRLAKNARSGRNSRLRIGVVVAAWDALPANDRNGTPAEYLEANLPLLHQFMASNDHGYEFAPFGTSVAGGDLMMDEEFRQRYQADPFAFGYVIHDFGGTREQSPDHTLPVAWAMGLSVFPRPERRAES
jgi:hypothetical protein